MRKYDNIINIGKGGKLMRPHTHRVKRDERMASLSFLLKQLVITN